MSQEVELAKAIYELGLSKQQLTKETKEITAQIKEKEGLLIEILVEDGKTATGHIEGVGNFILARSVYPNIVAAKMPDFIDSLRDTPDFSMVKEVIATATLKAYLKNKIQETTNTFIDTPDLLDSFETGDYSPIDAAKKVWEKRGVRIFDEVKLQHRDKGK